MYSQEQLHNILSQLLGLQAETELVEFKKAQNSFSDSELGQYFSALSNEANLKGAYRSWLVFGIHNETHTVLGTNYKPSRPSLDALKKKIADQTTGRITFEEIYEVTYLGKRVIMFQIPPAPQGSCGPDGTLSGQAHPPEQLVPLPAEKDKSRDNAHRTEKPLRNPGRQPLGRTYGREKIPPQPLKAAEALIEQ